MRNQPRHRSQFFSCIAVFHVHSDQIRILLLHPVNLVIQFVIPRLPLPLRLIVLPKRCISRRLNHRLGNIGLSTAGFWQIRRAAVAIVCHAELLTNAVVRRVQARLFRFVRCVVPRHGVGIQRINRFLPFFLLVPCLARAGSPRCLRQCRAGRCGITRSAASGAVPTGQISACLLCRGRCVPRRLDAVIAVRARVFCVPPRRACLFLRAAVVRFCADGLLRCVLVRRVVLLNQCLVLLLFCFFLGVLLRLFKLLFAGIA